MKASQKYGVLPPPGWDVEALKAAGRSRPSVEPSLYFNLKTGLYEGGVQIEGKMFPKTLYHPNGIPARNVTEARRLLRGLKTKADEGEILLPTETTWEELATTFLAEQKKRLTWRTQRLEPNSYEGYEITVRVHIASYFSGRVDKTTHLHLNAFLKHIKGTCGYSKQSQIVSLLKRMLMLFYEGNPTANPWLRINPELKPKEEKSDKYKRRRKKALRPDDVYRFLALVEDEYRFIVTILMFTGMRISEVIGLRWCDVDLVDGAITVRKQLVRGVWKDAAKTPAGEDRVIPLLPYLQDELERLLEIEVGKGRGGEEDNVCFDSREETFRDRHVLDANKAAAAAVGVPYVMKTHTLRAWFVSTCRHVSIPEHILKDMVGHDNGPRDVTDDYTHPFDEELTQAMVVEKLLSIGFGARREAPVPAEA